MNVGDLTFLEPQAPKLSHKTGMMIVHFMAYVDFCIHRSVGYLLNI